MRLYQDVISITAKLYDDLDDFPLLFLKNKINKLIIKFFPGRQQCQHQCGSKIKSSAIIGAIQQMGRQRLH